MYNFRHLKPIYTGLRRLTTRPPEIYNNIHNPQLLPKVVVERLLDRELIQVQGENAAQFLQGLITNDISHLQSNNDLSKTSMYAMFLNKAGRVLYDTIIYRGSNDSTTDKYYIECDTNVSQELQRHLKLYRVRRKIDIDSLASQWQPWIIFNTNMPAKNLCNISAANKQFIDSSKDSLLAISSDPRLRELGVRIILSANLEWSAVAGLIGTLQKTTKENSNDMNIISPDEQNNHRLCRYRYGIGEGVLDLPPGKCFPMEANGDYLHGISFFKGCYIGQELTARTHHTGVVRKRLMPLKLQEGVTPGVSNNDGIVGKTVKTVSSDGRSVGTVRGICGSNALALMRVEQALQNADQLLIEGELACSVNRPLWWPNEVTKREISTGTVCGAAV